MGGGQTKVVATIYGCVNYHLTLSRPESLSGLTCLPLSPHFHPQKEKNEQDLVIW